MAVLDFLVAEAPQSAYLFPSTTTATTGLSFFGGRPRVGPARLQDEALFFQYWPQSLTDDYQVQYAEHQIPGGSHPLYQWVGGAGRTISFEAVFTSEINTDRSFAGAFTGSTASAAAVSIGTSLLPSINYTVDVAAALSRLRAYMMPKYEQAGRLGNTAPPQILSLVFPNTGLGGGGPMSGDMINVILRSAPITYESWFPNGQPRVATVTLTFNEIVQSAGGASQNSSTQVKFIGRDAFESGGSKYRFRGLADRAFVGS